MDARMHPKGGQDFNTNLNKYYFTVACIGSPYTRHSEGLGCRDHEYTPIGRKEKTTVLMLSKWAHRASDKACNGSIT